jgi:single-strand DNA-binding protein
MNTVSLIGRLTADPELRTTTGGTPVCTDRPPGVNRARKDGQDQGAVFIDVVSFGRQAEAVAEHLAKGRQVAVTGRLEHRQWEGQDGSPRSRHDIGLECTDKGVGPIHPVERRSYELSGVGQRGE